MNRLKLRWCGAIVGGLVLGFLPGGCEAELLRFVTPLLIG